ncbi:hypothetical protein RIF29_39647 [Crotalaria pallida]|uniref:Late embryogenesis abundant protein LEA-2 subgroup domain-containing protein n=1 Tax=Crotalaria pallida TaxID=3830 RepID=A0AAN9E268_CROPI
MSFSTPQVESRIEFSPLPQQDVDQEHEVKDHNIVMIEIEPPYVEQRFDWDAFVIVLRLALVSMLLVGLAVRQSIPEQPTSKPIPPRFFIDSLHIPQLKITDGELSSTLNVKLTISNDMNSSNINIMRLDVAMSYSKDNKTISTITPIHLQYALQRDVFLVEADSMKRVHVELSTTGWEKDQPVVDDNVIREIAQDIKQGFTKLGLQMRVLGEVEFSNGWTEGFVMYPSCNYLEVKFKVADEEATVVDGRAKECIGPIKWEPMRTSL